MSERRFRKPNAFKHGAFSSVELLPWEDVNEYEELRRRLFEEHQPEGPSQEECVDAILSCMWRKRRVRHKRNLDTAAALERIENRVLWEDPPPLFDTKEEGTMYALKNTLETRRVDPGRGPRDDYAQLLGFSSNLYGALESGLLRVKISMLPQEFAAHLNEKLPCEKFEKTRRRCREEGGGWGFAPHGARPRTRAQRPLRDRGGVPDGRSDLGGLGDRGAPRREQGSRFEAPVPAEDGAPTLRPQATEAN